MTRDLEWHENKKLRLMENAAQQMLEALVQWREAQRAKDAVAIVEAQFARDAAIKAATGEA
jgi:hypothetical protein